MFQAPGFSLQTHPISSNTFLVGLFPSFNDALLAKVSWRLLTKPSSMLAKVLLGKYCQSSSFLDCKVSNNASHGWRGICLGRDLLKTQLGRAIGTGKDSKIWQEPWISLSKPVTPMGPATQFSQELTVADLICPSSNSKSGEYSAKTGYLVANLREERPLLNPPVVEFDWLREICFFIAASQAQFGTNLPSRLHSALPKSRRWGKV